MLSDSFDRAADSGSGILLSKREGGKATASYRPVTLFGADADRGSARDAFGISDGALVVTDARIAAKGPASLALLEEFSDARGPFLIQASLRPGDTEWAGFKWGPRRDGNWPDISYGVSVSITPAGRWTVWANHKKTKNVVGAGRLIPAEEYRIRLSLGAPDVAGIRLLSLSINGTLVLAEKAVEYPWEKHHLVFQALAKSGAPGSARIDDLSVEKLGGANNPAVTANRISVSENATGIWIEGEDAFSTNFHSGKVIDLHPSGPSGGMFLRLQARKEQANAPAPPYYARYGFEVPPQNVSGASDSIEVWHVWIAATPQNAGWASPLAWRVNDGPEHSLKGSRWAGAPYGNPGSRDFGWVFGWIHAGAVALASGRHELEVRVTEPRADGNQYIASLDSILITNDAAFVPAGVRPRYSSQPSFEQQVAANGGSIGAFRDKLNRSMYYELIGDTREQVSQETADFVLSRIAARGLPAAEDRAPDLTEFGVHGMERPFVVVGRNAESPEVTRAYDLLARAGVDSLRTADSCWHRLHETTGQKTETTALHLNFSDLDFQVSTARRYGMTHLFTVGYPPDALTVVRNNKLAACDPAHYPLYRDYFDVLLRRYKGAGVRYVELANEVDAPEVWWRGGSTPAHYVAEMKILREAVDAVGPAQGEMKTAAFAATYSRNEELGGAKGGRRFVSACFDLGIDRYVDVYAVHYLSGLKDKGYHEYFRGETARVGSAEKPLINTEQGGRLYPYDGAKDFARVFFLYGMPRMDFFLARDFYEGGYLKPRGLFDIDWRPKLRLLAYAFSVDAMRGRELVGIAEPAPGVEAYVLKRAASYTGRSAVAETNTTYSIVLWKNDREVMALPPDAEVSPVGVDGFRAVRAAFSWDLGAISYDAAKPRFLVGDAPVAIYVDELPRWELRSREDYLAAFEAGKTEAPLPGSIQ